MTKRLLGTKDARKVKTQAVRLKASRMKPRVGLDLELVHGSTEDDPEPRRDLHHDLNNPMSLMIAYSIPGARPRSMSAMPSESRREVIEYFDCPLDVAMRCIGGLSKGQAKWEGWRHCYGYKDKMKQTGARGWISSETRKRRWGS